MNILIKGYFGKGNFGDDALFASCVEVIRRSFRSEGLVLYVDAQFRLMDSLGVRSYRNDTPIDLIVYGGGTQFFAFREYTLLDKVRYIRKHTGIARYVLGRLSRLYRRIKLRPSQRTVALGMGLGPFRDRQKEQQTATLLQGCGLVHVRDVHSLEHCRAWGLSASQFADLCFYTPELFASPPRSSEEFDVGFVVRDWPYHDQDYLREVILAAQTLERDGLSCQFLLFSSSEDVGCEKRLTEAGLRYVKWCDATSTIPSFLADIAGHKILVTARYHGAVMSTLLGRPFVTINLERKLSYFSDLFPIENSVDTIDAVGIATTAKSLLSNYDYSAGVVAKKRQELVAAGSAGLEDLEKYGSKYESSL